MAAAVCPQIRSEQLLALIDPKEYKKVSEDPVYKASLLAKKELCEETIFWMDFNIDGITLFKSSKAPQVYYIFIVPSIQNHKIFLLLLSSVLLLNDSPGMVINPHKYIFSLFPSPSPCRAFPSSAVFMVSVMIQMNWSQRSSFPRTWGTFPWLECTTAWTNQMCPSS
jgi:hypothetical protein